ncbi:MAG: hypothetical protein KGM99_13345 [Burkholderiales bacterium]|nr:hypothetical protein [Burkholderiales bacterium]
MRVLKQIQTMACTLCCLLMSACSVTPVAGVQAADGQLADVRTAGELQDDGDGKSMLVDQMEPARRVLLTVPAESAMERFEVLDASGRNIAYVALTEGDIGGLVFIDGKFFGTVTRQDALAFYSCRGYSTATDNHWAKSATAWTEALLRVTQSATSVKLHFTGKSTFRSIMAVVNDPALSQIGALVDMGTNPFNIFRKLNSARENMEARNLFEKTRHSLSLVTTGTSEEKVAEIIKPEEVFFANGGVVMAYPRFSIEFFVSDGIVKVIQQPSFYHLSRTQAALFYVADTHWDRCTPENWRRALPELKPDAKSATEKITATPEKALPGKKTSPASKDENQRDIFR